MTNKRKPPWPQTSRADKTHKAYPPDKAAAILLLLV